MNSIPLVSIVMPMRNSEKTVLAAVRSIQLQTLQHWELIIIDDGSSDKSYRIVSAIDDDRIRLVRKQTNGGLARRLNQAIELSRVDFIARMDADDVCFPERLSRQVAKLQSDPTIDILGCGAAVFSENGALVGLLPVGTDHEKIVSKPFVGFSLPHPTWCGRATWFRSNPYDSQFMKAEDNDLLLRTFQRSRFCALETVLFGYRQHRLDLRKILLGRYASLVSMWRYGRSSGEIFPAFQGVVMQVIKGLVDILTIGLGFNRIMQARRLNPVPQSVVQEWQDVQEKLGGLGARL